ncbi:hypothetical protein MKX03_025221 [Papaver bracteatum]|nr:hypothetical protein MKX03_025221 [Papaver bracteatum]
MKKHDEIQHGLKKACEKRWSLENMSDSKAGEKKDTLCQKDMITRRPLYDRRSEIIETIPHFWLTDFLGHHALGLLLSEEDQKIFEFLKSVNVEDTEDGESRYTITFKLLYSDRGVDICGCTIKWKDGINATTWIQQESLDGEGEKQGYINGDTSFINWFSDRDDDIKGMTDEVAYIIIDDFWPNTVKYFVNGNFTDEEELAIDKDCHLLLSYCNEE